MKSSIVLGIALVTGFLAHAEMKCPIGKECETQMAKVIDAKVEKLTKELQLDADQQAKIKASLEKMWAEKCATHTATSDQLQALSKTTDSEIRSVLSAEQQKKFDTINKESTPCCGMAGKNGHKCPMNEKPAACCPMKGDKSKK